MAAPYYSLLDKCSAAVALYLRDAVPDSASVIYTAKRALDKVPPCVVVNCETAVPEIFWSGRYVADVSIAVSYPPLIEPPSDGLTNTDAQAADTANTADIAASSARRGTVAHAPPPPRHFQFRLRRRGDLVAPGLDSL